ncbi:MAG: transposase [Parcubacteria group bacterium]
MRNISFVEKEFYHIYNKAVDKKNIFVDEQDMDRFFEGMKQFNTPKVIGEIGRGHRVSTGPKLVDFVAYCVNPNHFHFILGQASDKGIEKFMHKIGMGYAKYFNTKYKRSGALFQGKFKAKVIDSNEYLLHLSAYINLNDRAHGRGHRGSTLSRTSWDEYMMENNSIDAGFCKKEIILDQFKNTGSYRKFAEDTLRDIILRKGLIKELEDDGIELIYTR